MDQDAHLPTPYARYWILEGVAQESIDHLKLAIVHLTLGVEVV
jgi:hypothetical protein